MGHSAGGWLARAFMADPLYFETPSDDPEAPHQGVSQLVTLGTPHCAPASELAMDMTGGALTWVNRTYPGELAGIEKQVCLSYACSQSVRPAGIDLQIRASQGCGHPAAVETMCA